MNEMAQQSSVVTEQADTEGTETEQATETETEPNANGMLAELGITLPEKEMDFEALWEENEDIYAWIYIPGTKVDYPILQHPTDDTYYLDYNIDGSKGLPGCIYTESVNSKDFSDRHTVIYGHNMKNDTMFGSLHDYEDRAVFDEHQYVYIYMPEQTYVYQIFAAYDFSAIHLIYNFDWSHDEVYQNYLDQIFEIRDMGANIRDEVELNTDNHIITLSTCISGQPNMRYLVQAVLLNDTF